jgi:type III restriction enzyme
MPDIKVYKTQDLVLRVNGNYNPAKLKLKEWDDFLEVLCGDREYQREAIIAAIIYLASGEYSSIEDLIDENWRENSELQTRYSSAQEYKERLQLPHKLSGVVDLATGTGKSFIIYGIAQIALGIGLVDKVLVLCPSLTIESGLKEKFQNLSGDGRLKLSLPNDSAWKNPRIVDATRTIKNGDIAVENIHAVYEHVGSSIGDSLKGSGERVLVLSDEVHHAYNASADMDIKKWKAFLLNPQYGFKYMLGFTGTAYFDSEYFNDVIYRYAISQAVDDKVIKSVEYVAKDDSIDEREKFQKIYDNHAEFVRKYRQIKPLTILVTRDIKGAKILCEKLLDFLEKEENLKRSVVEKKVLVVTSDKEHKKNLIILKRVDDSDNPVEWIVSVSMLTEGWDVKNVFQIVPWEDRAFNSKLLIAQVLGRGLRIPEQYKSPQPKVRVFNHDAWSKNIRGLVDEVLEIEMRLISEPIKKGGREKYNFDIYNIGYLKNEKPIRAKKDTVIFDYSRKAISLVSQAEKIDKETEYEDLAGEIRQKRTTIHKEIYTLDEVVDKIVGAFKTRDFEAKIRFPKGTYSKEHLPPDKEIKDVILRSMQKVGIKSGVLTEDNAMRVYSAFQTLFRKRGSTVIFDRKVKDPQKLSTKDLNRESVAVGTVRHGATVFYTDKYGSECSVEVVDVLNEVIEDQRMPRSASRSVNYYNFKTPVSIVLTKQEPERKFVEELVSQRVAEKIDSWIKSRDLGFYSIEYSWRKGEHTTQNNFNPDFFIKSQNNLVVVEIKSDGDDSEENKAKFKWGQKHFSDLNRELKEKKIKQRYFFHFLSPENYTEFFNYLVDGRLFKGEFKSSIETLFEQ